MPRGPRLVAAAHARVADDAERGDDHCDGKDGRGESPGGLLKATATGAGQGDGLGTFARGPWGAGAARGIIARGVVARRVIGRRVIGRRVVGRGCRRSGDRPSGDRPSGDHRLACRRAGRRSECPWAGPPGYRWAGPPPGSEQE